MSSAQSTRQRADLAGAIDELTRQEGDVTHLKVGTVGFCMGGALSLFAASSAIRKSAPVPCSTEVTRTSSPNLSESHSGSRCSAFTPGRITS